MANPNIVNVTDIRGKTATLALTTAAQTLLSNAASSGKVFKINSLYVANIDGSSGVDVTVNYYSEDDIGGTATALVSTALVPPDATLVVISKDSSIYLEEDKSIGALAGGNSDLVATISYEEIS
jgi:hypothetical protein